MNFLGMQLQFCVNLGKNGFAIENLSTFHEVAFCKATAGAG